MLAGPPAANARRPWPGTSTRRPAPSTTTRRWAEASRGMAAAASAAPRTRRRVSTSASFPSWHRDDGARPERDPLDVPRYLSVDGSEMHVQIGVSWSEDATMPARVEAEHLDHLALELKPDLRLLVKRRGVRQAVTLVEDVIRERGCIGAKQEGQRRPVIEARLPHQTHEGCRQCGLVVNRAQLDRLVPRIDGVVHEKARPVAKPRLHLHAAVDDPRDAGFAVEDRDLARGAGTRTERIEVRQIGHLAQRDLAAHVAAQHVALGADPANAHRVAAGGGRNPRRPRTVCPSRLVKRSRYACAMAACLAPATTAAG